MKKKKGEREEARIGGRSLRKNESGTLAVLHPEMMVEKAAFLLGSDAWEEVVVGLTVTTGRCVREIVKTGVLSPYEPSAGKPPRFNRGMKAPFLVVA
jgi:hypothetical protein